MKNIIFYFSDQQRWDTVNEEVTPNLMKLADEGVLFENSFTCQPVCGPARSCLQSGMYATETGCYTNGIALPQDITPLAEYFNRAGYQTAYIGKWHLGSDKYPGIGVHCEKTAIPKDRQGKYQYWRAADCLEFTSHGYDGYVFDGDGNKIDFTGYRADCINDFALEFLDKREKDKPFFLFASFVRPHPPFDAPRHYFDLYNRKSLRPPFIGSWETEEYLKQEGRIFDSKTGPVDPELARQAQAGYYACITHLDHQIGRLILALVEQELYDDTVFIFTSDHGEELCDHHMFRKSRPYEGSCHIPLIISPGKNVLPKLRGGSVCHSIAELRDIMPTVLDLAHAPVPSSVDGESLLPLTADPQKTQRTWLHGEHSYGDFSNHWIVTAEDKYIWHSVTGQEQYFDLAADPHELTDLIRDPSRQARISRLRSFLMDCLAERPEGFTDGTRLIPGRPYPPTLPAAVLP